MMTEIGKALNPEDLGFGFTDKPQKLVAYTRLTEQIRNVLGKYVKL